MRNKNIISSFLATVLVLTGTSCSYGIDPPSIREVDGNTVNYNNETLNTTNDFIYRTKDIKQDNSNKTDKNESSTLLEGGITELRAIVGKSQIINFDEPVKRLSITKPDLVDMVWLSSQEIIMNGLKGGETTMIIWGETGDPIFFNLFVENSNMNFVDEVERIAPGQDLEIDFVNSGSDDELKVVLKGKLSSSILKGKIQELADAYNYELVDLTESLTPQIMLALKVVEVDRSKSKGRNLETYREKRHQLLADEWWDNLAPLIGSNPEIIPPAGMTEAEAIASYVADMAGQNVTLSQIGSSGFNYSLILPKIVNGRTQTSFANLRATETEGLVKILSEPKIMATHGSKAVFNSGQEVPVLKSTDPVTGQNTYEYRSVGINLEFTPIILEDSERILLDIVQEISSIDSTTTVNSENITSFGFTTKKSETQVELENGQTMVLAGLIQKNTQSTRTKTPWISNIPVIGKFFDTNNSVAQNETEYMIFITPEIIKPYDIASGV